MAHEEIAHRDTYHTNVYEISIKVLDSHLQEYCPDIESSFANIYISPFLTTSPP